LRVSKRGFLNRQKWQIPAIRVAEDLEGARIALPRA
jgi:hypothetical protein